VILPMTEPSHAVFLSYASQDAEAAQRICEALRAGGIEVWFDQSELRGGDAWDQSIRKQIKTCALFIPVISQNTHERAEGYFRLEWKLAVDRSHLISADTAFLLPVVIDDTPDNDERVPERFREVQWTRLPTGETPRPFVERVQRLLSGEASTPIRAGAASGTAGATTGRSAASGWSRRVLPVAVAVVVFGAIAYLAIERPWIPKPTASAAFAPPSHSVAVLPFVDMSEKHDQEYFSDGLSEELIDHLAHIPNLKVIARTSSFAFKGKSEDMRTIASKLGVANLLEGSVRKAGPTLRITAKLIRASDGVHLWSQSYDRDMRDIFKVQDAIATAVVNALQVALAKSSARERPVNTEAYQAILRGRYFGQMETKEDSDRAIAAYREAIRLDPENAIAFAELAMTYYLSGFYSWMPLKDAYAESRAAIDRSLKIDPTLALAHRVLGWIERAYNFDFVTAQAERQRADELDPADPLVTGDAAFYAFVAGHLDEAIRLYRQIAERSPLDADAWFNLWIALIRAERLTEAEATARTVLELNPRSAWAHCALGLVLLYQHTPDAALTIASEETDEMARLACQSDVLWALGRRPEADALLSKLIANHAVSMSLEIAERFAVRNEKDKAFMWLDRAYEYRVPEVIMIRTDETLRNLHGDPRWKAFLRKMNLPE
jgi:adenylate cyclase